MNKTKIQWTWATDPTTGALIPDSGWTWNPLVGCRKVSSGCENCYAERLIATRLSQHPVYRGLAVMRDAGPQFTGEHRLIADRLDEPLRKKNPKGGKTFVNDLGDLFFEGHTNEEIAAVFGVMAAAPWHTFQVLTKRATRMREWFEWIEKEARGSPLGIRDHLTMRLIRAVGSVKLGCGPGALRDLGDTWPLPNVWLGVSVEDQAAASRVAELYRCRTVVRFVSVEPQVGPVDLREWLGYCPACDKRGCQITADMSHVNCGRPAGLWTIDGGESGPRARPFDLCWMRDLRDQCKAAGVPFFPKQLGAQPQQCASDARRFGSINYLTDSHGGDEREWPADLRGPRAFPATRGAST